jgi:hypothetical protein
MGRDNNNLPDDINEDDLAYQEQQLREEELRRSIEEEDEDNYLDDENDDNYWLDVQDEEKLW